MARLAPARGEEIADELGGVERALVEERIGGVATAPRVGESGQGYEPRGETPAGVIVACDVRSPPLESRDLRRWQGRRGRQGVGAVQDQELAHEVRRVERYDGTVLGALKDEGGHA